MIPSEILRDVAAEMRRQEDDAWRVVKARRVVLPDDLTDHDLLAGIAARIIEMKRRGYGS